ncbi:hypothetical protein SDC9_49435 [bioreactor metagenome]|uniref:Transglutaminase-like domain-containing protein n=1 Tax=bioreactor metagenome TaxID=1076179 RepID=A0A644WI62_9ZZZZ
MKNINVGFTLYNYAEFYEIAGFSTAEDGCVSLETGYGDLLVWMTDGTGYSWWKLPADVTDTITVVYEDKRKLVDESLNTVGKFVDLDFTPPYAGNVVSPSTDKAELNKKRLKEEDSIRADYESYFSDSATMVEYYKVSPFRNEIAGFMQKSRGNYMDIAHFYGLSRDQKTAIILLSVISEKDLRDTPYRVLLDHLKNADKFECKNCPDDIKNKYVLNPRIGRELLSPWRSELQNSFSKKEIKAFRKDPEKLKNWVLENIAIDSENNYYGVTLFPASVLKMRVADEYSRNVFFVACCRSFGIPARLEPATYAPEYYSNNQWISAFPRESAPDQVKGQLVLTNKNSFDPVYYTHYTIAVLRNGRFISLDYETDESLRTFPCTLNLDPGTYRLMTGSRQDDGSVLTRWTFFKIEAGKSTEQAISFNENIRKPAKLFTLDMQSELSSLSSDDIKLSSFATGEKGVVIALVDPLTEPGRHFLAEMQPVAGDFDKWGGSVLLVLPKDFNKSDFSATSWKGLPMHCSWMFDETGSLENEIRTKTCTKSVLPEVMYVNNLGEVYYLSRGYQVNTAHILLKTISQSETK